MSIRLRILKGDACGIIVAGKASFTGVDPFEDTESFHLGNARLVYRSFTGVDPFEDTER